MLYNVLFLLFSFSFQAFAQDCPEVNYYKEENSPLLKLPVYDQDGAGICYAYVASDLANYHLMKNGENKLKVDPIWAAFSYSNILQDGLTEGGRTAKTLATLSREGICPQELIEQEMQKFSGETGMSHPETVYFLERFFQKLYEIKIDRKNKMNEDQKFQEAFDTAAISVRGYQGGAMKCIDEFETKLKNLDLLHQDVYKVFAKNIFKACNKKTVNKDYQFQTKTGLATNLTNKVLDRKIKELFNENQGPISIGYCSKALYDKNYDGLFYLVSRIRKNSCSGHASSLVGSRSKNGKCEYLLRNSWGAGWHPWTRNWSCSCQNNVTLQVIDDCNPKDHPGDSFTVLGCWLPSDHIVKNTESLDWIKN